MADGIATAFAPCLKALPAGDGRLVLSERTGFGIVTILARAGRTEALVARIVAIYGLAASDGPSYVAADGLALIGTGPGAWILLCEDAPPDWAGHVADDLACLASVFDQSAAYGILRLAGPVAATLVGKGAFIDLYPAAFPPGRAAVTVIEHIGVIVWRCDADRFELAISLSLASSFWHWLIAAAAAIGIAPGFDPSA